MTYVDHAAAEFDLKDDDDEIRSVRGWFKHHVLPYDFGENARILLPVHGYEYYDHHEEKIAFYAGNFDNNADGEHIVQGSYSENNNRVEEPLGSLVQFRVDCTEANESTVWLNDYTGSWHRVAHRRNTEKTGFQEFDVMTEIQAEDSTLPPEIAIEKGDCTTVVDSILTENTWGRQAPEDVVEWSGLGEGSDSLDGDAARLDWSVNQANGSFVFQHYVEP